jgi:hypothetical protein
MTISTQELDVYQNLNGVLINRWILNVAGLTAGAANTIPHGMPSAAWTLPNYQATSGTPGFETQPPDATNLYYTTGAGQTSLRVEVEFA